MADLNTLLRAECARLEIKQTDLQEEIRQRADQLAQVKARLEHIRALLGEEEESGSRGGGSQASNGRKSNSTPLNASDLAVEILSERSGEPMYYKDLAREVVRRGGTLNGATPWATLSARMVQDERFVRPTAKGFYALRRDYPNARNVGARRKSTRSRSRSKT